MMKALEEEARHEQLMARAIELARRRVPRRPFAALLVDGSTGEVVAEGWNRSDESPLLHGEMDALERLFREGPPPVPPGRLRLYSTAEPCPMCTGALHWSGVREVVFGTRIATLSKLGWDQIDVPAAELSARTRAGRRPSLIVTGPVLEVACDRLFREARSIRGTPGPEPPEA